MDSMIQWTALARSETVSQRPYESLGAEYPSAAESLQAVYEALPLDSKPQSIRLISLHPGTQSQPICCTLYTASLEDGPEYDALSYSWTQEVEEEDPPTRPLFVNDTPVHAHASLHSALFYLRDAETPRTLWIDFLCIDQSNIAERNAQVRMMSRIYRAAAQAVCFLGEDDSETALGIQLLSSMVSEDKHLGEYFPDDDAETIDRKCQALNHILRRQWFFRIWTVQEVILSKAAILVCGGHKIPWNHIRMLNALVYRHNSCCRFYAQCHVSLIELIVSAMLASVRFTDDLEQLSHEPLCELIERFLLYRATDPRDHIFALLGLLDQKEGLVEIDYSLDAEAVFRKTAVEIMRHERTLTYFVSMFTSRPHPEAMKNLPTWVADFSHLKPYHFWKRASKVYQACGTSEHADFVEIDLETVAHRGAIVDRVAVIDPTDAEIAGGEDIVDTKTAGHLFEFLQNLEGMVNAHFASSGATSNDIPGPSSDGESPLSDILHKLYRTLAFGIDTDDVAKPRRLLDSDVPAFLAARTALAAYAASPSDTPVSEFFAALDAPGVFSYALTFTTVVWNMRFFITERNRIGVGPIDIREGDDVVVLKGGQVPFILRKGASTVGLTEGLEAYTFVGIAYVDGIMDGEAVERSLPADDKDAAAAAADDQDVWPIWEYLHLK